MKKTDVEFKPHPIPEEKVEESQGGLTDMANALLLCDKAYPLYGNGLEANPDAEAWCYGKGLPREVKGLEGKILPATPNAQGRRRLESLMNTFANTCEESKQEGWP